MPQLLESTSDKNHFLLCLKNIETNLIELPDLIKLQKEFEDSCANLIGSLADHNASANDTSDVKSAELIELRRQKCEEMKNAELNWKDQVRRNELIYSVKDGKNE